MEEIARYECQDDEGSFYVVVEWQMVNTFNSLSGSQRARGGSKFLNLLNGASVTPIDDNTFKIVQTGKIIRKIV